MFRTRTGTREKQHTLYSPSTLLSVHMRALRRTDRHSCVGCNRYQRHLLELLPSLLVHLYKGRLLGFNCLTWTALDWRQVDRSLRDVYWQRNLRWLTIMTMMTMMTVVTITSYTLQPSLPHRMPIHA